MQATAILTSTTTDETAQGATLVFPYPVGAEASDFKAGQTVYIEVYSRQFDGLAVSLAEDGAVVTWPSDAPYPLPAGTYSVEFQTSAPQGLPDDVNQAVGVPLVEFSVTPAVAIAADADLPTTVAAYNDLVKAHNDLATAHADLVMSHNALVVNLQEAGLVIAAPTKAKKTTAKK
jgi:hypothetical protein